MVFDWQQPLDPLALTQWSNGFGIGLMLFPSWSEFVDQALFWSAQPKPVATSQALRFIHQRLVTVGASPEAVAPGRSLTGVQP